jgi:cysteinyl-tRNA synthetase
VFSRAWFHTRHLQVEGQKMSKSKGNFFTARDLFAKGVTPAALRLELVRTHYRSNANFTMQGLQDCQRMIDRWSRAHAQLVSAARDSAGPDESRPAGAFEQALPLFTEALSDDLNLARAIASLNEAVSARPIAGASPCPHRELASLLAMDGVLGVLGRNLPIGGAAVDDPGFAARVEALIAQRAAARAAKDWPASDRVRDELAALGVTIKDGPSGTTWTKA